MNGNWEFFTKKELACKHCGERHMDPDFMGEIDTMRGEMGFQMTVTSAYRCPDHPEEARKAQPGAHTTGRAIDLLLNRWEAYRVVGYATIKGWRVGLKQKGSDAERFVHLDNMSADDDARYGAPLWTY